MPEGSPQDYEQARQAENRPAALSYEGSRQRDVNANAQAVLEFEALLDTDPAWRAEADERARKLEASYRLFDEYIARERPELVEEPAVAAHRTGTERVKSENWRGQLARKAGSVMIKALETAGKAQIIGYDAHGRPITVPVMLMFM
jgi:hypothetical protein